jgi:hypothetical protein
LRAQVRSKPAGNAVSKSVRWTMRRAEGPRNSVVWVSIRSGSIGLCGAATGILLLDVGIVLSLEFSGGDSARFLVLQLLMLVVSLTGLILGTLISERNRTERRLSQEEERLRLLLEFGWRSRVWGGH